MVSAPIKSSMSFTEKGDESQCEVIDKGIAQIREVHMSVP